MSKVILTQARVMIYGRVQGVCFRGATVEMAQRRNVNGYVRNLPGNCVEALYQGTPDAVQEMIAFSRTGPALAHVTRVKTTMEAVGPLYGQFEIRY